MNCLKMCNELSVETEEFMRIHHLINFIKGVIDGIPVFILIDNKCQLVFTVEITNGRYRDRFDLRPQFAKEACLVLFFGRYKEGL